MEPKIFFKNISFVLCFIISSLFILLVEVKFKTNLDYSSSNTSSYLQRFCFSFYDPPFVLADLNLLVTPLSICLAILFAILNSFQNVNQLKINLKKFKVSFIRPPLLYSVFRKKNRFNYALVFALTSFQIFFDTFNSDNFTQFDETSEDIWNFSKLLIIFKEIFQVLFSTFKLYPLLVAISSKIKIIRILGGFYAIYKLISDKIEYTACSENSIIKSFIYRVENKKFQDFLIYSYFIPQYLISSYLSVFLIFGTFLFKRKSSNQIFPNKIKELVKLSYQKDEMFFTSNDLGYCQSLFKSNSKIVLIKTNDQIKFSRFNYYRLFTKNKLKIFSKWLYDHKSKFRYSLRFICTQFSCFFCNYYLIVFIMNISMIVLENYSSITDSLMEILVNRSINMSKSIFYNSKNSTESVDYQENKFFTLNEPNINIEDAQPFIFLIPLLAIIVNFLYQFVKGIREYKIDFIEMCKGKSKYQSIYKKTSNSEISIESFKYCGFYVGKLN